MKILILLLMIHFSGLSQEDSCGNFKKKKEPTFNVGLRVNNLVVFSITKNEKHAKRPLYYKAFFPNRSGILVFKRILITENTYFHHPKDHLLVFFKNRGHIGYNAMAEMDGEVMPITLEAKHLNTCPTILIELLFMYTNHNFFGDK